VAFGQALRGVAARPWSAPKARSVIIALDTRRRRPCCGMGADAIAPFVPERAAGRFVRSAGFGPRPAWLAWLRAGPGRVAGSCRRSRSPALGVPSIEGHLKTQGLAEEPDRGRVA
jgi:hypothetical protein